MKNAENDHPNDEESLKELLQRRHELDQKLEDKFTRLLTVMFTDIKGSTEFYELRGDIDGRILLERHNQILNPILKQYNGRSIKSTGDGMMIVFERPLDGVKSALDMQRQLWEFNKGKRKQDQLHVRISLNYGKVIEDDGDVYGLEVSIASRINSVAHADQILISDSLYEEVKNAGDIVFHRIMPVSVKGVKEPLTLYQVIWGNEEVLSEFDPGEAGAPRTTAQKRKTFVIGVAKETEKIKISGYEKTGSERKTVKHYEEIRIDEEKIGRIKAEIISLLNRANQKGHVSRDILGRLKANGQLLYNELFSDDLKRRLSGTQAEDLIISTDDNLVDIPWELLYDGRTFLCIRFNMGRLVSTRQNISEAIPRKTGSPLKMLVLSDPQGNLKSAYREGFSIRDKLDYMEKVIHINIRSSNITTSFVRDNMRNFDILHYSGHADYDSRNPSESGFLLEDGKLKATDIIGLVGEMPFPSLVFSNACKSGHTDKWIVDENYGSEIYGLANAFLLAGVNHYIGTFWDVQDEPGLYFAIAFYSELMRGVVIGEAVRKARMELIRKYGEETIIWASYMLYGDPAHRYVSSAEEPKAVPVTEKYPEREPAEALTGAVRSIEHIASIHSKNRTWIFAGSALLLVLCALVLLYIAKPEMNIPVQQVAVPVQEISKEDKQKQVDELVASLIRSYNEGQKKGTGRDVPDNSTSQPTMVFLNIKSSGVNEMEKEYIFAKVTEALQATRRVKVVEREVLDKLLQELRLSSSELADPNTALKVGRILSARIMSTGSIMREGNDWQISMRLIETETTSVKAALTVAMMTKDKNEIADGLGREIVQRLRTEYPLQGGIVSIEGDKAVVSIGSGSGITSGLRMEIFTGEQKNLMKIGELEIVSAEQDRSQARITSGQVSFMKGLTAREIL